MANKYLITLVLSTAVGVLAVALLHVVWPVLRLLPTFFQYVITGVGGAMCAIYLADTTRARFPLVFEPGSDGRPHAISAGRGR